MTDTERIEALEKKVKELEERIKGLGQGYTDLDGRTKSLQIIGPSANGYGMLRQHPCTICGSFDHDALKGHPYHPSLQP